VLLPEGEQMPRQPDSHTTSPPGAARLALCVVAFLLAVGIALPSATGLHPAAAAIPALRETPVKQYRALRRMHATNEKFDQDGSIECWTELDGQGFRYEIVSQQGSAYIREKVLEKLLRREQELIASGDAARAELTDENYEFGEVDAGDPGRGERTVRLTPKRKDMLLVNGRMILNETGTELLRVEGRLSKNPSFWTSAVEVVREFARLDGVRVPVTIDMVAKVKFAGTSRLDVRYEYETINGRPVSVSARQVLAEALNR
jgi:hypothetical protein